jgi:hypothetical protein
MPFFEKVVGISD